MKIKVGLMAFLLAGCCFLTYYFHQVLGTGIVFTHFFYVPIILAALWWKRKGLAVAVFLGLFPIFSYFFFRNYVVTGNDYIRAFMFVVVSFVVAFLSEKIAKSEAVRESEEKYRGLIENAIDGIAIIQGIEIKFVNLPLLKIFGYQKKEEMVGHDFREFVAPESKNLMLKSGEAREKGNDVSNRYNFKALRRDGTEFDAELSESKITYQKGTARQGIIRDISMQKKSAQELRKSEKRYRALFEQSRDAIVITTQRGEFIDANPVVSELFGYTREEILKMNFQELYVDRHEEYRFQKEVKEKDAVQDFETRLRRKDGVELTCIFDVVCRRDDDGNILGYQGLIRDISKAKRTQDALKASQQRLTQIIDFLPDATMVIDLEGKVIAWNRAIEEMTGIKAEDMLGKGDYEYAVPFYGERRPVMIDLVNNRGLDFEKRYLFVREEGDKLISESYIPGLKPGGARLSNTVSPLYDVQGKVTGAIESIRDITDRRRAEEQIKESLREKEVLLQEIHHRVKNNMQVVSSLLHLQLAHMEGKEPSEILRECDNRIRTMASIHESLYQTKDFAKIDCQVHFEKLISHLLQSYAIGRTPAKMKVNAHNIQLDINRAIPCGLIINEIVSNSLKYAFPDNKECEIEITFSSADDKLVLEVKDNGVGLPEGFNLQDTRTLGLKIVKTLTDQLDGSINISGDGGTTVKIVF